MPIYEVTVTNSDNGQSSSARVDVEDRDTALEEINDIYGDAWDVTDIESSDDGGEMLEDIEEPPEPNGSTEDDSTEDREIYRVTAENENEESHRTLHVEATTEADAAEIATSTLAGDWWTVIDIERVGYNEMADVDTVRNDLNTQRQPENTGVAKDLDEPDEISLSPGDVLEANADLYRRKEDDYGEAWRIAGETLAMWADDLDIEFDPTDPQSAVTWNLYMQRLHKLVRAFNLNYGGEGPNNESITESHADASTYAAIHASYVNEQADE